MPAVATHAGFGSGLLASGGQRALVVAPMLALLIGGFVAVAALRAQSPAQGPSEYEVKAAFLYNFAKFVEWPQPPAGDQKPLSICVLGENPFGDALEKIAQGHTVDGRPLRILYVKTGQQARACDIVFLSSSEKKNFPAILAALRGASVLTVADADGFAQMGGVINLVLENDHVRFEINIDAAKAQHLRISSKLLSLAKIVRSQRSFEAN